MGERSWARLTIGGTVSRSALAGALEALEGLRLESCLWDLHVVLEDPEASWGGFSELEAWLQARGIPFDLESGACPGGWPDMLVHFRPGRGRVEFVSDDSHAEPVTMCWWAAWPARAGLHGPRHADRRRPAV
jgi:hypothetical protein